MRTDSQSMSKIGRVRTHVICMDGSVVLDASISTFFFSHYIRNQSRTSIVWRGAKGIFWDDCSGVFFFLKHSRSHLE